SRRRSASGCRCRCCCSPRALLWFWRPARSRRAKAYRRSGDCGPAGPNPPTASRASDTLRSIEDKSFVLLVAVVTAAFAWIVWPFYGAVLWGAAIAILFAPLYRRLRAALRGRDNVAALATLLIIVVIVIVPLVLVGMLLVRQAAGDYDRIQAGELDFERYLLQTVEVMPDWGVRLLARAGITNLGDLQ